MNERIALWRTVAYRRVITDEELRIATYPELILEEHLDSLLMVVKAHVLTASTGEPKTITRAKVVTFETPKSWWDHFKLTYKNRWWMPFKKINITLLTDKVELRVTVESIAMFPYAEVPFPRSFNKPVIYYEENVEIV